MLKLSASVAGLFLVAACGGVAESDVDWSNYSPGFRQAVQEAVDDRDCTRLGNQFLAAKGIRDTDLMGYVDGVMRDAGCP